MSSHHSIPAPPEKLEPSFVYKNDYSRYEGYKGLNYYFEETPNPAFAQMNFLDRSVQINPQNASFHDTSGIK